MTALTEWFTVLPYHGGVRNNCALMHVQLTYIWCAVSRIQSWIFTGTSTTLRDKSRRGWRIYAYLSGEVRNKGLITSKIIKNSTCIRTVFKMSESVTSQVRQRLYECRLRSGLRFYVPAGVRNKWLITQKRKFDVHSHSFQGTELNLHRYVNDSTWHFAERLASLTLPPEGSGIKG